MNTDIFKFTRPLIRPTGLMKIFSCCPVQSNQMLIAEIRIMAKRMKRQSKGDRVAAASPDTAATVQDACLLAV